jgi:hypothetical protein
MTVQVYTTTADIQYVLSESGVTFRADDWKGSSTEAARVASAIEATATRMNMIFQNFTLYSLVSLAANEWCKWCNAWLAAAELCRRRGNAPPQSILEREQYYEGYLKLLQNGVVMVIPGTPPTYDGRPAMTNFTVEPARVMPVRRQPDISTGKEPDGNVQSWPAYPIYDYDI